MERAGSRKGRLVICDGRAQSTEGRGELPYLLVVREPKPHAYLSLAMPRESAGREGQGRAKALDVMLVGYEADGSSYLMLTKNALFKSRIRSVVLNCNIVTSHYTHHHNLKDEL